jgi:hypothetical protein
MSPPGSTNYEIEPGTGTGSVRDSAADAKPEAFEIESQGDVENGPSKLNLAHEEGDIVLAALGNIEQLDGPIDPEEERKLVRKIDWTILPYLAICYTFFYVCSLCHSYSPILQR